MISVSDMKFCGAEVLFWCGSFALVKELASEGRAQSIPARETCS